MQTTPTPPPPPQRKWTDEQRQEVKALLEQGATALMVARAMNIGRNAALGRIWRDPELSLTGFSAKQKRRLSSRKPRPPRAIPARLSPVGDVPKPSATATPPDPVDQPISSHRMALIGTGRRWCKWPVAMDTSIIGGIVCCGDQTESGDVYCWHHRNLSCQAVMP